MQIVGDSNITKCMGVCWSYDLHCAKSDLQKNKVAPKESIKQNLLSHDMNKAFGEEICTVATHIFSFFVPARYFANGVILRETKKTKRKRAR